MGSILTLTIESIVRYIQIVPSIILNSLTYIIRISLFIWLIYIKILFQSFRFKRMLQIILHANYSFTQLAFGTYWNVTQLNWHWSQMGASLVFCPKILLSISFRTHTLIFLLSKHPTYTFLGVAHQVKTLVTGQDSSAFYL